MRLDTFLTTLRREGYGSDDGSPDLFFVNFKIADVVGHRYIMDSPEMEQVLRAQDSALSRIIAQLDSTVQDYVVILTSDHGHTPSPERRVRAPCPPMKSRRISTLTSRCQREGISWSEAGPPVSSSIARWRRKWRSMPRT